MYYAFFQPKDVNLDVNLQALSIMSYDLVQDKTRYDNDTVPGSSFFHLLCL